MSPLTKTPRRDGVIRAVALALGLTIVATACAGDVGKYRDAAAGPGRDSGELTSEEGFAAPTLGGDAPFTTGNAPAGSGADSSAAGESAAGSDGAAVSPGQSPEATSAAPAPDGGPVIGVTSTQIVVGIMYPKTGHYAAITQHSGRVVQAAFNEVNEKGGIHGRKLVLETYDDGSNNANTVTNSVRQARNKVLALIIPSGAAAEVGAPLAGRDGLPTIVGNIPESLARGLRFSFAGFTYWSTGARILPSFIANRLNARDAKIGVVFETTATGTSAKDAFREEAKRAGLDVVAEQPIAQNQAQCTNEVTNLQTRGVDLVAMFNGPLGAICMLRDSRALRFEPTWTGFGSWTLSLTAVASGGAANGIVAPSTITTLETPAGQSYSRVMRKHYPDSSADEDDLYLQVYAPTLLLIEALRRAGPDLTRERFVQTMETQISGFDSGFLPPPHFGPGDRSGPRSVAVIKCCTNDRWTTVDGTWRERF